VVTRLEDVVHVPHRMVTGLSTLPDQRDWLVGDASLSADLWLKDRLLREERQQVFVELDESTRAQAEARDLVVRHVETYQRDHYQIDGNTIRALPDGPKIAIDRPAPPLETAARLVQEDLCVLECRGGDWILTAGAVCFPTRWDLPSKLGLPLLDVHARVPGYADRLATSTDRFFDHMQPGRIFQRGNWSLLDDPELFQPVRKLRDETNEEITPTNAGTQVWLRREHQTLQRLPSCGAALFTLRVMRAPLGEVASDIDSAVRLAAGIRAMPNDLQHYKSLPAIREAVLGYLDPIIAAP
jgi:hypothetical protein